MKKADLDLYTDYLLSSCGVATATGLSAMVDEAVSHDKVTRFLSERQYTSKDLWAQVKATVRTHQSDEGVLIFDDTIQEKAWTDESELMCWHYDHVSARNVRGINLLNALYNSKGASIPVAFELVTKPIQYCDLRTRRVTRTGTLHLVCSDLTCDHDAITTTYKRRWEVEVFHKSLKSNACLAKSPTQTLRTQSNHVFMAICAAFKLECLSLKNKLSPFAMCRKLLIKASQTAYAELQFLRAAAA